MKPIRLVSICTMIAGVISVVAAPIAGTTLRLTALGIYMLVHLAKAHDYTRHGHKLGFFRSGNAQFVTAGII